MTQSPVGKKHICPVCHARFFDLGKSNVMCPKCGANTDENAEKSPISTVVAPEPEIENVAAVPDPSNDEDDLLDIDVDIADIDDDDEDDEDGLMEDTSDLGDVDDDVLEILEHVESPNPLET